MANIISGTLTVPVFSQTGNVGEYTIEGATYNSQTDSSGNGAYELHVGMVLYVPASDTASFTPINGVVHRYKITDVLAIDAGTVNATIIWDEEGDEVDAPTNGAACILTEVTPNKKLGYSIATEYYPELNAGVATGAANSDLINIIDKPQETSSSGPVAYVHTQAVAGTAWMIQHNKRSKNFVYTIFDDMQSQCLPNDVEVVDENRLIVHLLEDMSGRAIFSFV